MGESEVRRRKMVEALCPSGRALLGASCEVFVDRLSGTRPPGQQTHVDALLYQHIIDCETCQRSVPGRDAAEAYTNILAHLPTHPQPSDSAEDSGSIADQGEET